MKEEQKEKRTERGITLIALVVTIVVLLILAGVAIAMLRGQNGILSEAESAKEATENKGAEEKVGLAISAARAKGLGALTVDNLKAEVENNYGGTVTGTEFPVTVTMDGKLYTVEVNGNVESAGARPTMTNLKIATDSNGTNVATSNTPDGTTLYITFGASIEGGTISKVIDESNNSEIKATNGIYSKAVTENGKYKFTIKGIVDNEEKTSEGIEVTVKEFEIKIGTVISLAAENATGKPTQQFYVISYDAETGLAKALAMYNLKVGEIYNNNTSTAIDTNSEGYGLQDSEINGTVEFASDWYWLHESKYSSGTSRYPYVYDKNEEKCTISQYVEAYKEKLGNTDKVKEISLASYDDINSLWSNKSNNTWLFSTQYWLGSTRGLGYYHMWAVRADGVLSYDYNNYSYNKYFGVRPVITIDM